MEKIEYEGTVWAINHNNPEAISGAFPSYIRTIWNKKRRYRVLTDAPENVKVGAIVVEIWPYHLDVAKVRTIRNDSFISGTCIDDRIKAR